MDRDSKIFVAGAETLLGSAFARRAPEAGYTRLVGLGPDQPLLTDSQEVMDFFAAERPEYVVVAAGESGGIRRNQRFPADLMLNNLLVACHVMNAAFELGVRKLLYLASSCCYPRSAAQPMRVESLHGGPLEPTNEAYALAKLSGLGLARAYRAQYGMNFIAAIPANSFGIGDDFDPSDSHVVSALIRGMHVAKLERSPTMTVWGTGSPRREFVYADDLADACVTLLEHYDGEQPINLGGGVDLSIRQLAEEIREVVGYEGELVFDASQPDGMPLKALESSALAALGWRPKISFREALSRTYDWFLSQIPQESPAHA